MIEIIPAIMPRNFDELAEKAGLVNGLVPLAQIDIMDGKFVHDKTWPFNMPEEPHFLEICREEEGLPFWDTLDYELDLMVLHPDENFEPWVALGPKRMIVHIESLKNPDQAFEDLQSYRPLVAIGVAINTTTDISAIEPFLRQVDFVQCMGIERIGVQGEPFDDRVLEKLAYLRKKYPHLPLEVDGAVSAETAASLIEEGAHRLAVGSAIFGGGSVEENIDNLLDLVQ